MKKKGDSSAVIEKPPRANPVKRLPRPSTRKKRAPAEEVLAPASIPTKKTAVILFNLGGPDCLENVRPFLFNLFYDKAILRLPNPLRFFLASFISRKRNREAQEIYAHIGNKSPIAENTAAQAKALSSLLNQGGGDLYTVHVAMRYWHPFMGQVIEALKNDPPEEIVFLPLYPQFSTTTTASSLVQGRKMVKAAFPHIVPNIICCYPDKPGFIEAYGEMMRPFVQNAIDNNKLFRILLSAHGLPERIVQRGDPYPDQLKHSQNALHLWLMGAFPQVKAWDIQLCYQSKVGPLKWLAPSTETALKKAADDQKGVILVPISFVSEHSETLYELDQQYAQMAEQMDLAFYHRVSAVAIHPAFIRALADLVVGKKIKTTPLCPPGKTCACRQWGACHG